MPRQGAPDVDPPTRARSAGWVVEEELRVVGGVEGADFGTVADLSSDAEGRVYVLDADRQQVHVLSDEGELLRSFGSDGQGPGEFRAARQLTVGEGGGVWVFDDGNGRYSEFDREGAFVQSLTRPIRGMASGIPYEAFDGSLLDWIPEVPRNGYGGDIELRPVRVSTDGSGGIDTLPAIRFQQEAVAGGRMPRLFFARAVVATFDGSGHIWFADSHEARVFARTPSGDTTASVVLPLDPVPVDDADRDLVRNYPLRPAILAPQLEELTDTKARILLMEGDGAGHVFVWVYQGQTDRALLDVVSEDGAYLGRIELPIPTRPDARGLARPTLHASEGHLYVAYEDEVGRPVVVRFRIEPA